MIYKEEKKTQKKKNRCEGQRIDFTALVLEEKKARKTLFT